MTTRQVETVIVGGGQAGLALSYYLKQEGREHVVLERAPAVANAWRNQRWDSFTLVTPTFRSECRARNIKEMIHTDSCPWPRSSSTSTTTCCGLIRQFTVASKPTASRKLERDTSCAPVKASMKPNVVIATGLYQAPKIPKLSEHLPEEILQIHSIEYKNASSLPAGAVLVVGTGQSGAQIAEELYQSGRKVYLSVGSAARVPRRFRGRDINDWFTRIGLFDTKVEELKSPRDKFSYHPQISGKNGGHSLNLHQFARDGVVLLGRVRDAHEGKLILAPDLHETLEKVDQFEINALQKINDYIDRAALKAPMESIPELYDGYSQELLTELDLKACGISTVIWATGYTYDYSLVKLPVVDADGYPIQKRGVTPFDGLYFLGMPWLHNRKSGILFGVGGDAAHLAENIAARSASRVPVEVSS